MSGLLHPTVKRSDALAVVYYAKITAPGPKTIRWKTIDAQISASNRDKIRCTDKIVWLSDCCTRPWNNQMHVDSCLLRQFVAVSWLQRYSRWNAEDFSFNAEIIECTDDFVCCQKCCWRSCLLTQTRRLMLADAADWLAGCKTSYWLPDRNVDSLQLIFNSRWLGYWKFDKTKWIWFVWDVLVKLFNVFFTESIDLRADFVFKKSSTTVESQSCFLHLYSAEIKWKI